MAGTGSGAGADWVEMCGLRLPASVVLHLLLHLDPTSLRSIATVNKSFHKLSRHRSLQNRGKLSVYSGPHAELPELQAAIPFPPPALLHTALPTVTTVSTAPQLTTVIPPSTKVILPVLPETVPLIAQVPDVVTTVAGEGQKVQISQLLPGYAPSYAGDYVPSEVNHHSFSTFANTISFNVSRYPSSLELTDSKVYKDDAVARESSRSPTPASPAPARTRAPPLATRPAPSKSSLEYVPAEYLRGEVTNQTIQTVSAARSMSEVKPEVLASGRVLVHSSEGPAAGVSQGGG